MYYKHMMGLQSGCECFFWKYKNSFASNLFVSFFFVPNCIVHLSLVLSLKNWAFETPLPPGISINLPWGGNEYFLELHILTVNVTPKITTIYEIAPCLRQTWK